MSHLEPRVGYDGISRAVEVCLLRFLPLLLLPACEELPFDMFKDAGHPFGMFRPSSKIVIPVDGDTFTEVDKVHFEALADDPEDGAEGLVFELVTGTGSVLATGRPAPDRKIVLDLGPMPLGDHSLELLVTDSTGLLSTSQVEITVNPVPLEVRILPDPAGTADDLDAVVWADGAEVDPSDLNFAWTEDGVALAEIGPTLPAANTTKGRTYSVTVSHAAAFAGGTEAEAAVTVSNTAPGAVEIGIEPAAPQVGDTLRCVVLAESEDPDGDVITYSIGWTLDGVVVVGTSTTLEGDTVEDAAAGVWACSVTPNDPDSIGETVSTDVLVVAPVGGD
jgi:hypothetical protein